MSNITPTSVESSAIQTDTKRRYQNAVRLQELSVKFGWARFIFQAAYCYEIYIGKLWMLSHSSLEEFASDSGTTERSIRRNSRIGERMREMIERDLYNTKDTIDFQFTERDIKKTFNKFFERNSDITLRELAAASADLQQFENLLNSENAQLPSAELTRMLESPKDPSPMLSGPAPEPKKPSMHDRIKAAGYLFVKGQYIHPETNEPITVEQMAEFIDKENGTLLLTETKKYMEESKQAIVDMRRRLGFLWKAYCLHKDSPEFYRETEAMRLEIEKVAYEVAGLATTVVHADEE